ncbi:MAG: serine hydrolase [Lachnospiraceae bacterium]|nr:serine hydrolase [Lachnospiraceae bacterium]
MKAEFFRKKRMKQLLCSVLAFGLVTAVSPAAVCATEGTEPPAAYYEAVQTDALANWPQGPAIYAESGILVDLDTQEILYSKNIDKQLYPASITKVMTTLVAIESSSPEEPVTFSQHALDSIEWDSSNIGCRLNETLTMEQCWYAMMLNSANEVCCGVAEHISGSIEAFVEKMNQKAAELGCTNTHFSNPNGLPDETHYTTAHDMALIANAAYQNETFRQVFSTRQYEIPPTPQYTETRYLYNHHKMMQPDTEYYYEGCLGGKTGYTETALNTLVTIASRNGKNLLCVTMRTQGRQVYTDTASLFDYGFSQTFPADEAALLTVAEPTVTETPTPEPSPTATEVQDEENGSSKGSSSSAADTVQDMFPVWIPLTAVFVIAVGLFVFKLYLESARKKRRRRRQRRRSEEDK